MTPQAISTSVTLPFRVGVIAPPNLSDLTECTESTRSPRTPRTPRRASPDNQSRRRGSCSPSDMDYVFDALPPPIEINEEDEKGSACSKVFGCSNPSHQYGCRRFVDATDKKNTDGDV